MDINTLKENFSDGKKPTGAQFGEFIDEAVGYSNDTLGDDVATQRQALDKLTSMVKSCYVTIVENEDNSVDDNIYKLDITVDDTTITTPNLMQGAQEICNAVEEIMNSYTGVTEV